MRKDIVYVVYDGRAVILSHLDIYKISEVSWKTVFSEQERAVLPQSSSLPLKIDLNILFEIVYFIGIYSDMYFWKTRVEKPSEYKSPKTS